MNDYYETLLAISKQVTDDYKQDERVVAALLVGSVSQGRGDKCSDIDIMMYYDTLPTAEEFEALQEAAKASGGGVYGFDPKEGLGMYKFIEGTKVDIGHHPVSLMEEMIEKFITDPQLDDTTSHIVMSGIQGGLPMHGEALMRQWQEKISQVPASFSRALVEKYMYFAPLAILTEMGVDRHDYAFVYETILECEKRILNLLCGLNGMIPPGKIKSIDHTLAKMTITPPHLIERLHKVWLADPAAAVQELYQIELELLDLVDQHYPDLGTENARTRLHLQLRQ